MFGSMAITDVVNFLDSSFSSWGNAVDKGSININSQAPVGVDDIANATTEQDVNIPLINNDTDPENGNFSKAKVRVTVTN